MSGEATTRATTANDRRPAERRQAESDWSLLPTLVVRSAGFPWQLIDTLRHRRTAEAASRLSALLERADQLHAGVPSGVRLTRGQATRLRNRRPLPTDVALPRHWCDQWNEITEAIEADRESLRTGQAADEADGAEAVAALVADPRFREAIACSSPGVLRDLVRDRKLSGRLRRQIAAYAQRLTTKCETMSFFGPVNYATVVPDAPTPAVLAWPDHRTCVGRRAVLSARTVDRLQAHLLDDQRWAATLVPRRKMLARTPDGSLPLDVLVAAADGRRTLGEISADTGLDLPSAIQALTDAMDRGLLTHSLVPAATEIDPTRWLAGRVPGADRLTAVVALLDRYPSADAETKVSLLAELGQQVGVDSSGRSESAAKFYNDRVLVSEAAAGALELTVGGDLAHDLRVAVPRVLDLLAHVAVGTRQATNAALARVLGPGRFPLARVLRECADLPITRDRWLTEALTEVLAHVAPDTEEVDLAGLLPAPPPPELPVLCSIDVMIAIDELDKYRAGSTVLVVGDIHDAPLLTPWALQFHPDRGQRLAERDGEIRRVLDGRQAVSVVARRRTGLPPLRFPGPVLELGPVEGPADRLALDEIYVQSDGERAQLRALGRAGELFLHNGELDTGVHTAFALPRVRAPQLPDGDHLPRLRYGNVVLARRRWRLDPAVFQAEPTGSSAEHDAGALARRLRPLGVPARFFAKVAHERKPIYVDTAAPLLVDGVRRLAAGAARIDATELLPGPDGLWLHDGEARFAAELRCVYLRAAVGGAAR